MPGLSSIRGARALLVLLFAAVAICTSPVSFAEADTGEVERAREHFETGRELFEAGRYREAVAEFARANAIAASPLNQYNIALCHDRLGNADAAIRAYRTYLEQMPDAANRRDVEARISALEASREGSGDASDKTRESSAPGAEAELEARERTETKGPEKDESAARGPAETEEGGPSRSPTPREAEPGNSETSPAARERARDEKGAEREAAPSRDRNGKREDSEGAPPGAPAHRSPGRSAAPVDEPDSGGDDTPLYKSWWFWGIAGVSALILIDIATASSEASAAMEPFAPAPGGGATLWRF